MDHISLRIQIQTCQPNTFQKLIMLKWDVGEVIPFMERHRSVKYTA